MDVKTLCLGVLTLGDASGYEIKKHFEEGPFAHFHAAGFGSIYPALSALHADGLVTCTEIPQDGRPDKKVYHISEAGRTVFREALRKDPAPDSYRSEAVFMMFFGDLLDETHLTSVFEEYLETYRRRAERMRAQEEALRAASAERRFVHGLGLAIYETVVDYMQTNRPLLFGDRDGQGRPRLAPDAAE